jgi:hypothetical protein
MMGFDPSVDQTSLAVKLVFNREMTFVDGISFPCEDCHWWVSKPGAASLMIETRR